MQSLIQDEINNRQSTNAYGNKKKDIKLLSHAFAFVRRSESLCTYLTSDRRKPNMEMWEM